MPSCYPNRLQDSTGFHLVPVLQQLTRKLNTHLQLLLRLRMCGALKMQMGTINTMIRLKVFYSNLIITIYAVCIGIFNWCKLGIGHVIVNNGDFDIPYSFCADH